MDAPWCQRCQRTTLRKGNFSRRKDGTFKAWCKRCCRKGSEKLKKMHARRRERKISKRRDGTSYTSRNANLRFLGFANYREYLASDLWDSVRFKVFMTKGTDCSICKKPADQVHHNRYAVSDLSGDTIDELHPVCSVCHDDIEFRSKDRKKLRLKQAKEKFLNRQKAVAAC